MVVLMQVMVEEVVHLVLCSDGGQIQDPCVLVRQSSTLSEKPSLTKNDMGCPVSVIGNGQAGMTQQFTKGILALDEKLGQNSLLGSMILCND